MARLLPWRRGWLRLLVLGVGCALLGACAAKPPPAPQPTPQPVGWQAAIGKIDVTRAETCTAVLVRPDLIVTTAHCLRPQGHFATASQIKFTSSAGPAVKATGVAIAAQGADVTPGKSDMDLAPADWALVQIAPPVTAVAPIGVDAISAAMARAKIAGGAVFYSGGYGQGAKDELRAHRDCTLLPPDPYGKTEGEFFFTTTCIVRLGDSGGPVLLIEDGRPKLIGLNVGFARRPKTDETIGIVVSAKAFAPYLGTGLVSQLFPISSPEKFPMN